MAHLALDAFDTTAGWQAVRPDGTLSDRITIGSSSGHVPGAAGVVAVVGAGAEGHRIEREVAPADLRSFDDLQLWVRADRVAGPDTGFLLELALGAADLAVDAPANRWRRLLPVDVARRWQPVIVTVTDTHERVRRGLRRLALTVVSERPFRVELSALAALRPELVGDVEAALLGRLDSVVQLDGQPVRATVAPDPAPGPAGRPHLRIRPVALRPAPERERTAPVRTDYTATGFALRPPPTPVDLDYAVDAVADQRADQRALVELVVDRIPPTGTLLVNGRPLPMAWSGPLASAGDPPVPSAPVRIASARPATSPPTPAIPPFNDINVEVDHGA